MCERLLLGPPLTERRGVGEEFDFADGLLARVADFLVEVYGDTPTVRNARFEMRAVARLPRTREGMWARRGVLLFALKLEPELADHLGDALARDLHRRVLPFVTARYVRTSFQRPDSFATLATVLGVMWGGERLGCWEAHDEGSVGALADARD